MNDAINAPEAAPVDPLVVTTQQYTVPEENLIELTEKVAKIGRKAVKLGLSAITLTKLGEVDVPFLRIARGEGKPSYRKIETAEDMTKAQKMMADETARFGATYCSIVYRKYVTVELTGAVPRLAGWDFVATLQHLEVDGEVANMLRIVPGFTESLPLQFRNCGPENCDHCHKTIRTRKETFVVRSVETGKWMQVGRNCTQDFLGGRDPHAVAKMLEYLQTAGDLCSGAEEGGWGGGHVEDRAETLNFLTWVAACVRIDGWVSRGKSRQTDGQLQATADQAFRFINPPRFEGPNADKLRREFEADKAKHTPAEDDAALALKALTYAQEELEGKMEGNDYLYNLWVACNQVSVNWKLIGIAGSLMAHYIKEVERQTLREVELRRTAASTHVGTVGERTFFKVQVLTVKTVGLESQFGPKSMHKMVTPEGNLIVWFNSGDGDLKTGQEYLLKATIKRHDEYQGTKQTIVNRAEPVTQEQMDVELAKAAKKAERAAKKAAKAAKEQP